MNESKIFNRGKTYTFCPEAEKHIEVIFLPRRSCSSHMQLFFCYAPLFSTFGVAQRLQWILGVSIWTAEMRKKKKKYDLYGRLEKWKECLRKGWEWAKHFFFIKAGSEKLKINQFSHTTLRIEDKHWDLRYAHRAAQNCDIYTSPLSSISKKSPSACPGTNLKRSNEMRVWACRVCSTNIQNPIQEAYHEE